MNRCRSSSDLTEVDRVVSRPGGLFPVGRIMLCKLRKGLGKIRSYRYSLHFEVAPTSGAWVMFAPPPGAHEERCGPRISMCRFPILPVDRLSWRRAPTRNRYSAGNRSPPERLRAGSNGPMAIRGSEGQGPQGSPWRQGCRASYVRRRSARHLARWRVESARQVREESAPSPWRPRSPAARSSGGPGLARRKQPRQECHESVMPKFANRMPDKRGARGQLRWTPQICSDGRRDSTSATCTEAAARCRLHRSRRCPSRSAVR